MAGEFELLKDIVTAIKSIKDIFNNFPFSNPLLPQKDKLIELRNKVDSLEEKINNSFPKLSHLVWSYSAIISEVKVARSISDKARQLIMNDPALSPNYTAIFANKLEDDYGRVDYGITQISLPDIAERGALTEKSRMIRDLINHLKTVKRDDIDALQRIFNDIATHYSDMEAILGKLLQKLLYLQ
ncbi:hypothetical protein NIES4074_21980 [Cylindrospermum sp. NIES-4074]|nr:hypothetical protein NIES4074_21980 [Cylindrospermum sp. NIES-4074]